MLISVGIISKNARQVYLVIGKCDLLSIVNMSIKLGIKDVTKGTMCCQVIFDVVSSVLGPARSSGVRSWAMTPVML